MSTPPSALPKYNIRELCRFSNDELWAIPDGLVEVIYDNGTVTTTTRRMLYTTILLRHFYNKWPQVRTSTTHDLGRRRIKKMTHADVMTAPFWDVFDTYQGTPTPVDAEQLCEAAYDATNDLYNVLTYRCEAYVRTISILDFMDVIGHPRIKEAQSQIRPTEASLEEVGTVITQTLRDPKELRGNRIAEVVRNGLVDVNQVLQCVGPRGYTTDIDSHIFREPILVGFAHGFSRFYDSLIDSRLAAKAQSFTGPPLQMTEYFNRQLQLLAHSLERLHDEDCGSQQYISWRVRAKDLEHLDGQYYRTPDGLARIRSTDHHLVDQLIEMRNVIYCQHPDSQGKCIYCYGELGRSIPKWTNIGHVASTHVGEKISQSVLAIKHVETSSSVGLIEFTEFERRYLKVGTNPNNLMLADRLQNATRIEIVIRAREAPHIADVKIVDDVDALMPGFVSELSEVLIRVERNGKVDQAPISVYVDNRPASLSKPVLHRIREQGWQVTDSSTYVIDLTGWDMAKPVFEMPRRHENMLDYAMSIRDFLCAAKRKKGGPETLRDIRNVEQALKEFYQRVTRRLRVNIVHLSVLIAATMVRSRSHRDYRLPLAGNAVEFGEFTATMYLRSMSAAMAYQGQKQVLDRPMLYMVRNRPSHPLDALLVPVTE